MLLLASTSRNTTENIWWMYEFLPHSQYSSFSLLSMRPALNFCFNLISVSGWKNCILFLIFWSFVMNGCWLLINFHCYSFRVLEWGAIAFSDIYIILYSKNRSFIINRKRDITKLNIPVDSQTISKRNKKQILGLIKS